MKALSVLVAATSLLGTAASFAQTYHLERKIPLTPDAGIFDYAASDSVNRHVFFSHGEEVYVLDADTDALVGKIPAPNFDPNYGVGISGRKTPFQGVHHVVAAPDLGRGFTANGRAGSSTIFDLKTLAVIGEIKLTGRNPNSIVYDATTKRVFTFNEDSDNASAFDGRTGKVEGTIDLGGGPSFAAADDKGHVFANIMDKNEVVKVDAKSLKIVGRWPANCLGPQNETMAIDKVHGRLFIGCRPDFRKMIYPPGPRPDRIMIVLDTKDGRVVATIPIGGNPDEAAFDPEAGLVFSANGEGNVTVIKQDTPDRYSVVQTVETEAGGARLAVDSKTHKIFVPNNDPDPSGRGGNFRVLVLGQ